jgi:hypothetical protein
MTSLTGLEATFSLAIIGRLRENHFSCALTFLMTDLNSES